VYRGITNSKYKRKKTKFIKIKTVIGDVVTHLKQQKNLNELIAP